jgi:hypothetical protein
VSREPKVSPRTTAQASGKSAKAQVPASWQDETPIFCFHHADRATTEAWKFTPSPQEAKKIVEFLCEIAGSTWREIENMTTGGHKMHHGQELKRVTRKAKRDAERKKLGETFGDEIFRFRLGSKRRLWGFRKERTFHVVWWDPEHKVYPTETSS